MMIDIIINSLDFFFLINLHAVHSVLICHLLVYIFLFENAAHLTDARSDRDLGSLKDNLSPWTLRQVPQTIPKLFLQCSRARYPAERCH